MLHAELTAELLRRSKSSFHFLLSSSFDFVLCDVGYFFVAQSHSVDVSRWSALIISSHSHSRIAVCVNVLIPDRVTLNEITRLSEVTMETHRSTSHSLLFWAICLYVKHLVRGFVCFPESALMWDLQSLQLFVQPGANHRTEQFVQS